MGRAMKVYSRVPDAPSARLLLVYDGDCGYCQRFARWVHRRDAAARIQIIPSATPGILDELGLSQADVDATAWTVSGSGEQRRGAAAVNAVLSQLQPWPYRTMALLYRISSVAFLEDRLYDWLATHRRCSRI